MNNKNRKLFWLMISVSAVCSMLLIGNWAYNYLSSHDYYDFDIGIFSFEKNKTNYKTSCHAESHTETYWDLEHNNKEITSATVSMTCDCEVTFNDHIASKQFNKTETFDHELSEEERDCGTWCDAICKKYGSEKFGVEF